MKKRRRDLGQHRRKALPDGWMRVADAASYANVSEGMIRTWMKTGLPHSRLSRKMVLIKTSNLDSFLESFQQQEQDLNKLVDNILKDIA